MPNIDKKKAAKAAPVVEKQEQVKPAHKHGITVCVPIDTDKLRVEVEGTVIWYHIKATGERLHKDYEKEHAVTIIYGRIKHDPHGLYTRACIGKIRAANVKLLPL